MPGKNKKNPALVGIDVGGANVKIVAGNEVFIHYCPLWSKAPLKDLLHTHQSGADRAAVVMSGELADCFINKIEGIRWICSQVSDAFPGAVFYGTDARFHQGPVRELAAANWLVSADFLRERYPESVLVDIGSTTTDIIPLSRFDNLLGLGDLERLQRGYLLYTGMLRTTIPALVRSVTIDGNDTPVSSEYFACSGDAHLLLGHIDPKNYTTATPDGKGTDLDATRRRLARVVCADPEEIGTDGIARIALAFCRAQEDLISAGIRRVCNESGSSSVIFAGTGAQFYARNLGGTDLSGELGPYAAALPAFSVREVAKRDLS
ncbi:MAG TPA: hydantoinase/oxoprolinase family protein [Methanoregulaceae archaeon]|nr:hydantoinase/oxoprolinase family protein [Methanoregulaceae archaeon]